MTTKNMAKIARKTITTLLIVLVISVAALVPLNAAHAQETSTGIECGINPKTWIPCMLGILLDVIAAVLKTVLTIFAWIFEVVLEANKQIITSPAVTVGFGVTLSLANLGFVIGIIIIAIATILRIQTYGIKQILWKLIFAAILVNFSLVIAKEILNFADSLGTYFVEAMGGANFSDFVNNFSSAFAPQKNAALKTAGTVSDWLQLGIAAIVGIAMLVVTIITMAAYVVMFLIRYIIIGILLILMPLAWVAWIFPALHGNWSKWWGMFLRWTFFYPVGMFFVYLALRVWQERASYLGGIVESQSGNSSSAAQAINSGSLSFLQAVFSDFLTHVGEQAIILALMIGGLFAANSLSIMGAKAGYGAAVASTKAIGGAVARKTGGLAARGAGGLMKRVIPPPTPGAAPRQYTGWKSILNPAIRTGWKAQQAVRQAGPSLHDFGKKMKASPGVVASAWMGAKAGSGLFKSKNVKDWECQNCVNTKQPVPRIIRSTKKPAVACTTCGAAPSVANWTNV